MSDDFDILGLSPVAALRLRIIGAAVVLLALAAGVLWYGEWRADAVRTATEQKYELAIGKLKAAAASRLGEETRKVLDKERELAAAHGRIEEMGHEREAISRGYEGRLAALAAAGAGRLRDPYAPGCGGGGGGSPGAVAADSGSGAGAGAPSGGLLSVELSAFLREQVRLADEVNDAYASCRVDAMTIRTQLSPP